jgi:hypothetical protein
VHPEVRAVVADHAADEARHHAYFHEVFRETWRMLPHELRRRIGVLVPRMIFGFLEPDRDSLVSILAASGEQFPRPEELAAEMVAHPLTRAGILAAATPTVRMLRSAAVFVDEPAITEAFAEHGLGSLTGARAPE